MIDTQQYVTAAIVLLEKYTETGESHLLFTAQGHLNAAAKQVAAQPVPYTITYTSGSNACTANARIEEIVGG